MSRIRRAFATAAAQGSRALLPCLVAGDPDLAATEVLLQAADRSGADILELVVPFSDPVADGPTMQRAAERGLRAGAVTPRVFALLASLQGRLRAPVVLLVYYNCILRYGEERFCRQAKEAGAAGLIVPDLPPEEGTLLEGFARENGLDLVYLLAPTSTEDRIRLVCRRSTGFVYCVSLTGVTGARHRLAEGLAGFLSRVRRHARLPLAVGFGVSTPAQAREAAAHADGVVVGSALVDRVERAGAQAEAEVERFVAELKAALGTAGSLLDPRAATGQP